MSIQEKEELIASSPKESRIRMTCGSFSDTSSAESALSFFRLQTSQWQRDVDVERLPCENACTDTSQVKVLFPNGEMRVFDGVISDLRSDDLWIIEKNAKSIVARFAPGEWKSAVKI